MKRFNKADFAELTEATSHLYTVIDTLSEAEGRARDRFDNATQGWQDSDTGQAYETWLDAILQAHDLLTAALDALEAVEVQP